MHTAPGHGADDFLTGVKYGLDIYAPVGPGGHFLETVELFGGERVFDANPHVEEALAARGRLWHRETLVHQYPHCWRCHNPVIFLATSQWFVRMDGEPVITVRGRPVAYAARSRALRNRQPGAMDSGLGTRPHLQHGVEPPGLVHLTPAGMGRADSGCVVHGMRRGGDHG